MLLSLESLPVAKDIVTIGGYIVVIITACYTFVKWIWPKISPLFINSWYYYGTGVHVLKDIEKNFGKEAGRILKDIIQQRGLEIVIDEMRLNIIENTIGIGIFICDISGKCTYANKTLARMFGISQAEMLGNGWLTPIVDKQKAYLNWKFSVDNGTPYRDDYQIEVDGKIFNYHTEAEPSIGDDNAGILGYVGIVRLIEK